MTELADAIYKKDVEKVRKLIKDKWNVNQPIVSEWSHTSESPLTAAVQTGNLEIIKLLVENGADVNFQGGEYSTAPLAIAAQGAKLGVLQYLLTKHPKLDIKDRNESTPMHLAIGMSSRDYGSHEMEYAAIVEALIQAGADIYATDSAGRTPGMLADYEDSYRISAILEKAGEAKSKSG